MSADPGMSPREKIFDRRQRIRAAIRDAAIEEFALNGLAGASTLAIAQRAGLTKPQLHYYIDSKEELYEQVLASIIEQWTDIFFLSTKASDPAEAIAAYVRRKIHHSLQFPQVSRLFANEIMRGAPVLRRFWGESRAAVLRAAEVIQGWIDEGRIRPVDPVLFQMHIWAVTQHYADYAAQVRYMLGLADDAPLEEERIANEAVEMFLRTLGLERAGPPERSA